MSGFALASAKQICPSAGKGRRRKGTRRSRASPLAASRCGRGDRCCGTRGAVGPAIPQKRHRMTTAALKFSYRNQRMALVRRAVNLRDKKRPGKKIGQFSDEMFDKEIRGDDSHGAWLRVPSRRRVDRERPSLTQRPHTSMEHESEARGGGGQSHFRRANPMHGVQHRGRGRAWRLWGGHMRDDPEAYRPKRRGDCWPGPLSSAPRRSV